MMTYKEIQQKYKLQELKEKLLSYPEKVENLKMEKYIIDRAIKETKEELELYSIDIYNKVFQSLGGKRSNKEERDLKFKQLAKQDQEYQNRITATNKVEDKSNQLSIEIEKNINQAKVLGKIIDLTCQELNFLSIIKGGEIDTTISNHKKIIITGR